MPSSTFILVWQQGDVFMLLCGFVLGLTTIFMIHQWLD